MAGAGRVPVRDDGAAVAKEANRAPPHAGISAGPTYRTSVSCFR
jgi:hypothetical protein